VTLNQKLHPIHVAKPPVDLEAIWSHRYKVCVNQLALHDLPDLEHEAGWLRYDSDSQENTTIYYAGSLNDIKGTTAVRVFQQGQIPEDVKQFYSLNMFENIDYVRKYR
jgi:hypothetical protein